jgi:hypothetical protein
MRANEQSIKRVMQIKWRCNATANTDRDTGAEGFRVRELRQVRWHPDASEAEEAEASKEPAETEQVRGLAFSPSAPLAFRSLSLLALSGEPIPSQTTASNPRTNDTEPLRVIQFALVVAKRLFVQISEQVERLNADVGAVKLSLDHTPEILHRVRVDVATDVLDSMIDDGMLIIVFQAIVGFQGVTEDSAASLNALANDRLKITFLARVNVTGNDFATTLHHSEHDLFALRTAPANCLFPFVLVHVPRLAADERFVNLNLTGQLRGGLILHRFADSLKHKPRGLLGQSKIAGDFVRRDSVLAIRDQPHCRKPLVQGDGRFVQERTHLDRELFPAFRGAALPDTASLQEHRFLGPAVRALNSIGPTLRRKVLQRIVRVVEMDNRFGQCFRGFHEYSMA